MRFVFSTQAHFSFSRFLQLPSPPSGNGSVFIGSDSTEHPLPAQEQQGRSGNTLGAGVCVPPRRDGHLRGRWKLGQKEPVGGSSQLPGQHFEALQKRCPRAGCLFEDGSFLAALSSTAGAAAAEAAPGRAVEEPSVRGMRTTHTTRAPGPSEGPGLCDTGSYSLSWSPM